MLVVFTLTPTSLSPSTAMPRILSLILASFVLTASASALSVRSSQHGELAARLAARAPAPEPEPIFGEEAGEMLRFTRRGDVRGASYAVFRLP